jgi:hypothetical protein
MVRKPAGTLVAVHAAVSYGRETVKLTAVPTPEAVRIRLGTLDVNAPAAVPTVTGMLVLELSEPVTEIDAVPGPTGVTITTLLDTVTVAIAVLLEVAVNVAV